MYVLSRQEIISLFANGELKLDTPDDTHNASAKLPYSRDNPFQQCSIDLRVGSIFTPEAKDEDLGGMLRPKKDSHVLGTGETVLIQTREKITLPPDVGAICFSPSRMALRGVIITNMGHVDPGYSGHLHFTAINMGKDSFGISADSDTVCTMLLFKLSAAVADPYGHEHTEQLYVSGTTVEISGSVYYSLPKLARDFLNLRKRAETAAKDMINETKHWQVYAPLGVALAALVTSTIQTYWSKPWEAESRALANRLEVVETRLEYEKRLGAVEKSVQDLRAAKTSNSSAAPKDVQPSQQKAAVQ